MPRKAQTKIDLKSLTKGQLRKLNALKKSVGDEIGEKAFAEWLATDKKAEVEPVDKNAGLIASAIEELIDEHKLIIPNTGYMLKRGRGRVIVTRAE